MTDPKPDQLCAVPDCGYDPTSTISYLKQLNEFEESEDFLVDPREFFKTLECGHEIHSVCLDRCLQQGHRCPQCRHPLSESDSERKFQANLQTARQLYKTHQYVEASDFLQNLAPDEQNTRRMSPSIQIGIAACQLRIGNYDTCLQLIHQMLTTRSLPFLSHSQLADFIRLRANVELVTGTITTTFFSSKCATASQIDGTSCYVDYAGATHDALVWTLEEKAHRSKETENEIGARIKDLERDSVWCFF